MTIIIGHTSGNVKEAIWYKSTMCEGKRLTLIILRKHFTSLHLFELIKTILE